MRHVFWLGWLGAMLGASVAASAPKPVVVAAALQPGRAAQHGGAELLAALHSRGVTVRSAEGANVAPADWTIVAGVAGQGGTVDRILAATGTLAPVGAEALLIKRVVYQGQSVLLIAGSDDRGLMYAELDAAERIAGAAGSIDPLAAVQETTERAAVANRAVALYTMNRAYWESRFYDEQYWVRYLDLLARDRFNSLAIIFGYENGGFLAPCYPYFFATPGFPGVRMVGLSSADQARNLNALNRLIGLAHDRGIEVTLGIWDHIYRGGVQGGGVPGASEDAKHPTPGLTWGLTGDNLIGYTQAALSTLVEKVPGLDGIQFRMHDESGLKPGEQVKFWREVFQMMKQRAPNLRLDLRAKGLPDAVIQDADDTGVRFRLSTKYWEEQLGLPFHPTHVNPKDQHNRRHGYADLLRYPRRYALHWQVFSGGTVRVLLWGDPGYVRRLAESTHLYDGDGFEITEPLATKMEGQARDVPVFSLLKPSARYTDYEFERYWYFYQVFGRMSFNPATPAEVGRNEFVRRFGAAAGPEVQAAVEEASGILPRIVASSSPYSSFAMTEGWVERQHLGNLAEYSAGEFGDTAQFESFGEEARRLMTQGETARTRPQETSRWFETRAASVLAHVAAAEGALAGSPNPEFASTAIDLRILSQLARYHARRIPAAVNYQLYLLTKDPRNCDEAIGAERQAVAAWRELVAAAGDAYADDLLMGARSRNLCGSWKTELASVEADLRWLEQQRTAGPSPSAPGGRAPPSVSALARNADAAPAEPKPRLHHLPAASAVVGRPLTLTVEVDAPADLKWLRVRYRAVNQFEDYQTLPLVATSRPGRYEVTIPGAAIPSAYDFMYYFEAMDQRGGGCIYPDFQRETPYVIVPVLRR